MKTWRVTYYSYGVKAFTVRFDLYTLPQLLLERRIELGSVISIEQVAEGA